MDKKEKSHVNIESTKFVLCGFVLLIFFSVAVFALLGTYMSRKSEEAIDDLGNMYIQLWRMLEEADGENFEAIDGSLSY